jgi:hypothetical protein
LGGNAGPAHGLNGAAGSDGAGSITFTNNVITVGSGIPGDTQLSGSDLLLLNLRVATIGPAGFFLPGTLNGGVGGNLAFSGNTFIGDGQSRLTLQLGSTGTAVVDTIANTISIDGSATNNTISGFTKFTLDTNDVFVAGGGNYQVTFAADPDTLVVTPNSGNVTLTGITSTNFLLDFRGFSPSFDLVALAADTNASSGSTVITLSPTSTITLQGYTGGISSGDVIFEPLSNAPPVTTAPASETVSKGTPFAITGANLISVADFDALSGPGETITVVLTDTTGLLSAFVNGASGGAILTGNGTQQLTISGGLGQVNAALGTLSFLSNSVGADQIDVATSDGRGGSDDHKIAISVVANLPPVTTAPVSEVASIGTPLAFTGADQISVADPDALSGPGENITVVLTDAAGLLSAFVNGASGGAIVTGSGTQQLTVSGGLGQVNAALATLSFLGNTGGPDQIDVATSDGRGGGDDHKIAVSVVANQPPVTTVPASEVASKATPLAFTGADQISVADPDALSGPGENITVVLTDTTGLLSAFVNGASGGAIVTGSGTQQLTISGGLGQVNAALGTLSFLSNNVGPDQIDVATSDGRGGSDDHKIAVSVLANQPPVTTVPTSETVSKGTPFAFTGADQISVADPDALSGPGENITVVLTDTTGLLSAFVDGASGGAIVTGSGTQQLTISGGLGQVNAALGTLSFLGNNTGPDQIDVATSDGRGGSDDHKIAVTVTPSTNVPFSIIAPSLETIGVNLPGSIGGIRLAESPTTSGETFSIVIADGHGALSASTQVTGGGGTIVNNDANTLTISGTLDQVNADLTTLADTDTSTAPDNMFILASNSNGGSTVALLDVTVNGAPTIRTPSDVRAPAGLATPVPLMKVSETGNTTGEFFVVTLSDVNGLLSATFGGNPVAGSGTNHLTLSGSLDQVNAELASLTITETAVGLDFITGGVGDGFGNASGQFMIPVVGEKTWTSTVAGDPNDWNNAANWTTSGVPVAGQDIFIPQAGPQPTIFDNAFGIISGTVTNNGTITIGSTTIVPLMGPAALLIDGNVFLQGTGAVVLSDSSLRFIEPNSLNAVLENGQTIEGAGFVDLIPSAGSSLAFHNDFSGVVNATGINALTFASNSSFGGQVTNDGVMEASGAGGLVFEFADVTNNGIIQANNGSHVDLGGGVSIDGGTLSTNGTGVIRILSATNGGSPLLDGASNGALTNLGTVEIGATGELMITGILDNFGTIDLLGSAGRDATLLIDQNTMLLGTGAVVLSDSNSNFIEAEIPATLDNGQTIEGAGLIDVTPNFGRTLTFHNDFNGTVNATGINPLWIGSIDIRHASVSNDGLMEASGTGGLILQQATVLNQAGVIQANNGSHVDLAAGVIIAGGTLSTNGTGVIRIQPVATPEFAPRLDGASSGALANLGTVQIGATAQLVVTGTLDNFGTINLLGNATQAVTLFIDQSTALQGTGAVVLSDSTSNSIQAGSLDAVLDNGQTIEGAGFINVVRDLTHSLTFHNDFSGIVNATGINALTIASLGASRGQVTNDGLMEASGTGGLAFAFTGITNNGIIEANRNSHVDLLVAHLSGTGGRLAIDANATIRVTEAVIDSGQTVQFLRGANEKLVLDDKTVDATTFGADISGFAIGDTIDLAELKITSAALDASAMLHLFSGGTEVASLQLNASNLGERFAVNGDGGAGTSITVAPITPPQVTELLARDTGASANDRLTNDQTLAGVGDPFAIVSFTEGSAHVGTATADATGAWTFTPSNLSQGTHTIVASETNAAGTGQASLTFTYDSVGPKIAITTPDAQIADPLLTLSGTGEAGTKVQLFDNALSTGGLVTVDATGHWSEQIMLAGTGTHFIIATDTDLAGNLVTSTVSTFGLDNQINAPSTQRSVTGTSGADHITISQGNILVSAGAGNDTITLTPGGNFQFHFLNGGSGSDTLDLSQTPGNVTANLAQGLLIGNQIGFSVLNSIENIIAGSGHERLIGSSGANVFEAGAGHDIISGRGGGDTFVFKAGFGNAVITDFHVATTRANPHDILELDHSLFAQFATVQALLASTGVTRSGSSIVIATDPTHTIELQHTSLKTLLAHANDVLFV